MLVIFNFILFFLSINFYFHFPLDSLCQCMKDFLMQGDWTTGAKSLCFTECDTLNFLIIGSPQPKFIGQRPVYEDKKPIDSLIEVFRIYGNAQVWDDNCFGLPGVNEEGFKRVLWTCKYSGDNLPNPGDLCEYIFNYVNGGDGNILNNSATHCCSVIHDRFYLDVVAKYK